MNGIISAIISAKRYEFLLPKKLTISLYPEGLEWRAYNLKRKGYN
jgi:hypothetical protein